MTAWTATETPFHAGERALQARIGAAERMAEFGKRVVRPFMPQQHRDFYAQLPLVFAGHVDAEGNPWASVLAGEPGFMDSPDDRTLAIEAAPLPGDPLGGALMPGLELGLLGMEFGTRRRNRLTGRVAERTTGGFVFAVDQAFGNCPQYIQTRSLTAVDASNPPAPERLEALDAAAMELIRGADTFFVASATAPDAGEEAGVRGADVSHRGGRPGFVAVDDDARTLTIPDYLGNNHFNTLGNFLVHPRAGLLFIDFERGDLLMLTGRAEVLGEGEGTEGFRGAERLWRFELEHGLRLPAVLPIRFAFDAWSPNSELTGTWAEAEARREAEALRQAWRPHRVVRVANESTTIRSFYLEPADGLGMPAFEAGQFLTLRLDVPGADAPVVRTYTVSSSPADPLLRISVKRDGLASAHLHDTLEPGDLIEVRAPAGPFTLDAGAPRPAVLIGAGVGVTPMVAMARHAVQEGIRTRAPRPTFLIQAARSRAERAFDAELDALEEASQGQLQVLRVLSRPAAGDRRGEHFHATGRVDADLLRAVLALDDYDFYLCGPDGFMQDVYDALRDLGVRDARINAEAFGPSALTRRPDVGTAPIAFENPAPADDAVVEFEASGTELTWTPEAGSLLEFAEAHGLTPAYGCRNGTCGSCATRVLEGSVSYTQAPEGPRGEHEALICCAVPAEERLRLEL